MKFGHLIKIIMVYALSCFALTAHAQPTLKYFPKGAAFEAKMPTPESYLGYEIGDWHISPDALTGYMRRLADESARVSIETIGYSHERHALTHVYISSPENIANLEGVLAKHQNAKSAAEDILVINLAYSVHGNEASGANASALVAYYLAASNDAWVKEYLSKTVVIIEPMQNPDGLGRFASFVNQHKGDSENFDRPHREHYENWPSGRTNHYWFDLNRDWIVTVHPESKARIKAYQKWRPQILGDYHEMGGGTSSYFFQPGHPKRTHPLTSKDNQRLTFALAEFHAKALDARSQPYFTQERYDDFYYGKASTYPDGAGTIGILFEQSSVRGHTRDMNGVEMRFQDAVANHLATSISLLKGSDAHRNDILNHRFNLLVENAKKAKANPVKAYVFSDDGDRARAQELLDILSLHKIPVYGIVGKINVGKKTYTQNHAWVVKPQGAQYGLIRSLFETRTTFEDNVFYDISTWNLPLAFNLPYSPLRQLNNISADPVDTAYKNEPVASIVSAPMAYVFEWKQHRAPHLLQALMADDLQPRLSVLPFSASTTDGKPHAFKAGAIIVQPSDAAGHEKIRQVFAKHPRVKTHGLSSGLSPYGPDLGSRNMKVLQPIKPALLIGKGVRPTEAGEIRYAVDMAFGVPLTLLDLDRLGSTDLSSYTHLLLADGDYKSWKKSPKVLKEWVRSGGVLIAQKRAAIWVEKTIIFAKDKKDKTEKSAKKKSKPEDGAKEDTPVRRAYQDYEQDVGKRTIAGAALWAVADLTHPLVFGYDRADIPVFYNAKKALSEPPISYDTPLVFAKENLLITGYASENSLKKIRNTPAIALHRLGKGKIVLLNHNANFRAFWLGTQRLYANALFFTQAIETRKDED
ncbi:MAG: peptidase M14 [Robiginitomaculum sp.]|nr:MAG: peptidase M14 [Robiginitomaculum sp.]